MANFSGFSSLLLKSKSWPLAWLPLSSPAAPLRMPREAWNSSSSSSRRKTLEKFYLKLLKQLTIVLMNSFSYKFGVSPDPRIRKKEVFYRYLFVFIWLNPFNSMGKHWKMSCMLGIPQAPQLGKIYLNQYNLSNWFLGCQTVWHVRRHSCKRTRKMRIIVSLTKMREKFMFSQIRMHSET